MAIKNLLIMKRPTIGEQVSFMQQEDLSYKKLRNREVGVLMKAKIMLSYFCFNRYVGYRILNLVGLLILNIFPEQ